MRQGKEGKTDRHRQTGTKKRVGQGIERDKAGEGRERIGGRRHRENRGERLTVT